MRDRLTVAGAQDLCVAEVRQVVDGAQVPGVIERQPRPARHDLGPRRDHVAGEQRPALRPPKRQATWGVSGCFDDLQRTDVVSGLQTSVHFARRRLRLGATRLKFVGSFAASVFARHGSGAGLPTATPMRLPPDENSNLIPDGGWVTLRGFEDPVLVADDVLDENTDDGDRWLDLTSTPATSGDPIDGLTGDGLTRLQEFRGFVVGGYHYRLDPQLKDLFVSSRVLWDSQEFGLGYALQNMPLGLYRVFGQDETVTPEYTDARPLYIERGSHNHREGCHA